MKPAETLVPIRDTGAIFFAVPALAMTVSAASMPLIKKRDDLEKKQQMNLEYQCATSFNFKG